MAENLLTGGGIRTDFYNLPPVAPPRNPLVDMAQAAQTAHAVTGLQAQQLGIEQQQFGLGQAKVNALHNAMASVAALKNPKYEDIVNATMELRRSGMFKDQDEQLIGSMTQYAGKGPEEIRSMLDRHLQATGSYMERMQAGYGGQGMIDTGGQKTFIRTDPRNPSVVKPGTSVQNTMAPGVVEGPAVNTPSGPVSTKVTSKQFEDIAGGRAKVGPGGQIIYPGQQAGTAVAVGAPAGAVEAASSTSRASAEQGNALQKASEGAPIRTGMLANLERDLEKFNTGPLAGYTLSAKRAYNDVAGRVGAPKYDEEGVAAHENFNKQATQLAQQQFAALGGTGTDNQLSSAFKSNPNDALSGMGNKQIVQMLKGNEDAIQAKNSAWQKWKKENSAGSYGDFQEDWNKNYSPRAFQFVRMTPSERKDLLKNMQPNEKAALGVALETAEKRGWIEAPK